MGTRLELHAVLEAIAPNVYFQPPPAQQMVYPCIVYNRSRIRTEFANDAPYSLSKRYEVTVIYRDADSTLPDAVAALPKTLHDRQFTNDNLYHDVFNLFF